ncbi:MAG: bifunctional folylpolyglutamate synthase/dihydrofolate synthase [Candidatus Bostrichicola ureolyticus]|nr:MAG: bifunctional folylpolyglutamate synthase/dihydrofolate synthase [Candidatus Bostrichicola ureolyticus]
MNYIEIVKWIFDKLPYKQNKKYKYGLHRIFSLCEYLKHPQKQFKSIHIGGTNGKGSTSHMLSSILQESGYKVGLFTSPHLKDFRERIRYNGNMIEKEFIISFIKKYKNILEYFSFFEIITALGFYYFKEKKVEIAIIEVGMGGRLDSTNIILPIISIITNISFDHIKYLGKNLSKIAYEKAGIIKPYTPLVIGQYSHKTKLIFKKIAKNKKAPITFVNSNSYFNKYKTDLKGNYQIFNQKTVVKTIDILSKLGIKVSKYDLKNGFKNVIYNTNIQGRWQILRYNPKIICDVGHNESGIKILVMQLKQEFYKKLHLVLGFVKEKNIHKMLSFFPKNALYYFCQPNIDRKFTIKEIKEITKDYKSAQYFDTVIEAFDIARLKATNEDLIFVGGSTFVVAEIL